MEIKIKEVYGNHQRVSEAMMVALEKLRVMYDRCGHKLSCYVDEYDFDLPIVLAIYEDGYTLCYDKAYIEAHFLRYASEQLAMLEARYNESYKHN